MQKDISDFSVLYNGFITEKGNYIWAGAMCLAWTQLKDTIIKKPIKLDTKDNHVLKMIENFNAEKFHKDDIDSTCIYVKSGYGKKTLQLINKEVKQKFPEKTTPPLDIPMQDDSIIAYAYLLKKLKFVATFQRLPDKNLLFNNQHNVDAFYAQNKQHRKQIKYCTYQNRDNFVLAIKSKNPKDLLFVVKSQKSLKVEEVFKKCEQKTLKDIGNKDQFMMPVVQLDLQHHINELKLRVLNEGFQDYHIQEIFENIKLKIDQSGAKVENEAVIMMNRCLVIQPQQPKQFVLDKSFWIVMKQQGKHPYLTAYIRNPIQTK